MILKYFNNHPFYLAVDMIKRLWRRFRRKKTGAADKYVAAPELIFARDSLRILDANEAAINLYGYTLEEFRVLTIGEIRPVWEQGKLARHLQEQKMQGRNSGIWKHLKKNGDVMLVRVDAEDVAFKGRIERKVTIKDITPIKAME